MASNTDLGSLTYELLKKMNASQEAMRFDIDDIKLRMSASEDHMRGVITSLAGLNSRMDRFDERMRRVERRLELRGEED